MEVDFHSLYSELGIDPDCGLDDFKRAYRRRVAELHPDRHIDGDLPSAGTSMALPELTLRYSQAMQFFRTHGRLPGSTPRKPQARTTGLARRPRPPHQAPSASEPPGFANVSQRSWIVLIVLLLLVMYLVFSAPPASAATA